MTKDAHAHGGCEVSHCDLICISVMTDEVVCLFMYLLASYVCFSGEYLFKSPAQF